jgi:hypothetical protein
MAYALASRTPTVLFDVSADFPSALALYWLFLEDDNLSDSYSEVWAGTLLEEGAVRRDELQSLMEQHSSNAALKRLSALKRDIFTPVLPGRLLWAFCSRALSERQTPNALESKAAGVGGLV